ncbi:unnamed protein product [Closterium sp. Naga37s-1]|nr:unnamed protein product [Closterium sp. Naga37s-1]
MQTGAAGPTVASTGTAGGDKSRKKKAARGHPCSSASKRRASEDDVAQLRQENTRLRAENAGLEKVLREQLGRVDNLVSVTSGCLAKVMALAKQVAVSDKNAAKRLEVATLAMSTTIIGNITDSIAGALQSMKNVAELVTKWLDDFDSPTGTQAVERATAVTTLGYHVTAEVDEARRALEETFISHIGAAQTYIADAVTRNIVLPPPPPSPATASPTHALPDELMKSFKADVLKAVTEATQQSFVASGLKLMTEVIGTVAPGRRGSSLSGNDAEPAQRREAHKQGQKREGGGFGGDGDDAVSMKRSKGAGGSRDVGAVGPCDSRTHSPSVIDQLKKNGAKVISGKGLSDKEIPAAQTATDGGARTVPGPSVAADGTTSIPRQPPAASSAPIGPSGAENDGPALAATPALAGPSAAKGDAANALKELLDRMAASRKGMPQHPAVEAAPAKTTRSSVIQHVTAPTSGAPPTASPVAACPPADPRSALLLAQLGARRAAGSQPEVGTSATPASGNVAALTPAAAVVDAGAQKGVRAALATGGDTVDMEVDLVQAEKGFYDVDIAAIQTHLEAAKRTGHPPALAISDTAHVEPSASPAGGSVEPTTATDAVGEGKSKRKGKADIGKGKESSQRKTRAMSATKEMSDEKGKEKAEEN